MVSQFRESFEVTFVSAAEGSRRGPKPRKDLEALALRHDVRSRRALRSKLTIISVLSTTLSPRAGYRCVPVGISHFSASTALRAVKRKLFEIDG